MQQFQQHSQLFHALLQHPQFLLDMVHNHLLHYTFTSACFISVRLFQQHFHVLLHNSDLYITTFEMHYTHLRRFFYQHSIPSAILPTDNFDRSFILACGSSHGFIHSHKLTFTTHYYPHRRPTTRSRPPAPSAPPTVQSPRGRPSTFFAPHSCIHSSSINALSSPITMSEPPGGQSTPSLGEAIRALQASLSNLQLPTASESAQTSASNFSPPSSPRHKRRRVCRYTPRAINTNLPPPPRPAAVFPPLTAAPPPAGAAALHAVALAMRHDPFPSTALQLILDTGVSVSVSPDRADFVGPISHVQHTTSQGIASGLPIAGTGTVQYTCQDDSGQLITITVPDVLYVPSCPARLICPRQLLQALPKPATASVTTVSTVLAFSGRTITVPYDSQSHLPILWTSAHLQAYHNFCQVRSPATPTPSTPANLTPAQLIKLRWHHRLNHLGFDELTSWMRNGRLMFPRPSSTVPTPFALPVNSARPNIGCMPNIPDPLLPHTPLQALGCPLTSLRPESQALSQQQKAFQPPSPTSIVISVWIITAGSSTLRCIPRRRLGRLFAPNRSLSPSVDNMASLFVLSAPTTV